MMNRLIVFWVGCIVGTGLLTALFLGSSPGQAADEEAGILVYPTSGLITDENGGTATFFIELSSRPDTPVEIPLGSSNPAEGVPEVASVKLTPGNWNRPQQVTIRGVADLQPDGNIAYTILTGPASSRDSRFNGLDAQDVALVNINDAFPSAQADQAQTQEDSSVMIEVLNNDSELDDRPVSISIQTAPQQGSTRIEDDQKVVYAPSPNYNGEDSFRYMVCDSDGDCSEAGVQIMISPLDDEVTAVDDEAVTTVNTSVVIDVLANDFTDDDEEDLFIERYDPLTDNLGLVIQQGDRLEYQPPPGFTGTDKFEYTASNGDEEDDATVTIEVRNGNGAPVATNDTYATGQRTALTIAAPGVLDNDFDPDGDDLQTQLVDPPDHGSLILNPNGSFTFTPNGTYVGIDNFTYTANDGSNQSNQATVSIDIKDQITPSVSWVSPVQDGGIYDVSSGKVLLKIEASDNVGIARVRFYRWDAVAGEYVDIGEDQSAPYQVELQVETLNMEWNQVFVRSYDRAGNPSAQQFIWLYKNGQSANISVFIPLIIQ